MFIDRAKIHVEAGHGGSGSASFRREMYVPMGGPDGGDGGHGGSVTIRATSAEFSLITVHYKQQWKAQNGGNGRGRKMHGADGQDLVVPVPVGTLVFLADSDQLIVDLNTDGQEVVLAKGGRGGRGNVHYLSSTNRAPRQFQPGEPGEIFDFDLELKTVADVGLVGYPNAGKSTLLCSMTAAHPKTAPYPFTTLHPTVGIVDMPDYTRFSIADIPGLIEGASENVGLGHAFLRHIERCRMFCYVLDMAGTDGRDPLDDLASLRNELELYEPGLTKRPFIIVANKMDAPGADEALERLRKSEAPNTIICETIAELSEGTENLKNTLHSFLGTLPPPDEQELNRLLAKRRVFLNDKTQTEDDVADDWDF